MNRLTALGHANRDGNSQRTRRRSPDQKGIQAIRTLPDSEFDGLWDAVILPAATKDQLLAQAILNFTAHARLHEVSLPLHGIMLLVGPPGTGKTSVARGLASRTPASLNRPGPWEAELQRHSGQCDLLIADATASASAEYFTGQGRLTLGTMHLTKKGALNVTS